MKGPTPSAPPAPHPPPPPLGFRFAPRRPAVGSTQTGYILDENWSESYRTSAYFADTWRECHTPSESWPAGVQVVEDKLYQDAKLCVPEDRAEALLMAFHVEAGHPGINRLKIAAKSKFEFPDRVPVVTII